MTLLITTGAITAGSAVAAEPCSNEAIRIAQRAEHLADCRAYEQVSPVDKGNEDVAYQSSTTFAGVTGNRVGYASNNAFPGSFGTSAVSQYVARREAGGWTTLPITPKQEPYPIASLGGAYYYGYDDQVTQGFLRANNPPLAPGAPLGEGSGYTRTFNGSGDAYSFLGGPRASFEGADPKFAQVYFSFSDPNTFQNRLYVSSDAGIENVGVLPDGTAAPNEVLSGGGLLLGGEATGSISENGLRAVFVSEPQFVNGVYRGGHLYLRVRDDGTPYTLDVSGSRRTVPEEDQPAVFWDISADGSQVTFMSTAKLTDDSTAAANRADLYRFDADTGDLIDLTTTDPSGADILGVAGASSDGSVIYFAATGELTADTPAGGEINLFAWKEGDGLEYLATLGSPFTEPRNWQTGVVQEVSSRTSADGSRFLFVSPVQLTSTPTNGQDAVYLYDAAHDEILCASCHPDGSPSILPASVHSERAAQPRFLAKPRVLSRDGSRVFFNTQEKLVPEDTNGKVDVYMYVAGEAGGPGDVKLISSGEGSFDSVFADATPSGDDAYFITRQRLLAEDLDNNLDLYDARVGGGFESPSNPIESVCFGSECQGDPSAPPTQTRPGSLTYRDAGNQPSAKSCAGLRRVAGRLRHRADRLDQRAEKTRSVVKVRQLRTKEKRLRSKSRRIANQARQCRLGAGS